MTPTPTPYREDVEKLRAIVKSMRNKADHDMEIHWLALESFADEIDAVLSSMGSTQDAREPVAWICTRPLGKGTKPFDLPCMTANPAYVKAHPEHDWKPLYRSPVEPE
jgi:hypothetical protein